MLTIYKASAGSGKTFQLVLEYLKILLKNSQNYKKVLAVTFTNKATNEMKSRILDQLAQLARKQKTDYLPILMAELELTEDTIHSMAAQVLKNILHDYTRFSISTIDSFTQRVIKSFNREMGISPYFTLELDDSIVLEEAVDRLLANIDNKPDLRKWLIEFSEEKITENRSQRIEDDIIRLGRELFNEKFKLFFPEDDKTVYNRKNLEQLRVELVKITNWFENELKSIATKIISVIAQHGFTTNDLFYGKSGVGGFLQQVAEGNIKPPGIRVHQAAEDAEKWVKKGSEATVLLPVAETQLNPLLKKLLDIYAGNYTHYCSAVEVKKQLRILGILTDLKEEIKAVLLEKGMLQLSDSNLLLSRIIGDSEAPFVYEKIGNHYNHFMLDEFQDTSALQWNNFKPLIANSLAEGNSNLLVGDVKQSIYRWRNSDWNILATEINDAFPGFPPVEHALEKNWRSHENIIRFNNAVMGSLINGFNALLAEEIDDDDRPPYSEKFNRIYQHFKQETGKPGKKPDGYVNVKFVPSSDFEDRTVQHLVEEVKQLQDAGYPASEIAILIRKNKEGTKIIEAFLEASQLPENSRYNLKVLSNESLFLNASRGVNMIIQVMELLTGDENLIPKAALLHLWKTWLKPATQGKIAAEIPVDGTNKISLQIEEEFISELQPVLDNIKAKVQIASLDETIIEAAASLRLFDMKSEIPYLQTLIDKAAELKLTGSNDLSNFLHWWKEKGHSVSVNINEEADSVRLITIHKSKGLEFGAVLLPYFNWDSSWKGFQAPVIWSTTNRAPFNQFPLLPVKASKDMASTWFRHDYYDEKISSFIDNLNLVYVALTRAKSILMVHAIDPEKGTGKSINCLLKQSLEQISAEPTFEGCFNSEKTTFTFGKIPPYIHTSRKNSSDILHKYTFNDFSKKIKLKLSSDEYAGEDGSLHSVVRAGNLVHDIMAGIKTAGDVKKACTKAFREGKIQEEELPGLVKTIETNLQLPQAAGWFDGTWKILNERGLLTGKKYLRPDRIMISGKKAVVIDYKTGTDKREKHIGQVFRYAGILRQTGFEKVEGYLWYLNQNQIEKVCDL